MDQKWLVLLLVAALGMVGGLVAVGKAPETLAATALGGVLGIATQRIVKEDPK